MQINQQKNVYNANRYMTWTQDTANPRIVYIDMRIPSCLLKKGKRSVLDFSIVLNDGASISNLCGFCTQNCNPSPSCTQSTQKCTHFICKTTTYLASVKLCYTC
jgi:hypothetical protein